MLMTYCSLPMHCLIFQVFVILLCMHITSICCLDLNVLPTCLPMCLHQDDKCKLTVQVHMLLCRLKAEHNTILREGQSDTKSWRQAKEEQKQLQQFFNRLADCLMCGLLLMLGGMLYWGVSLGYFEGRLSECKGRRAGFLANIWSPWQTVESLQTMWCYAAATLDLTGSVLLMLAVPLFVKKHGLLTNSMAQPMTGLILGLGVACGLVGQFTVSRVGGDNMAWLSFYWVWIALHVLSIWMVHSLYSFLSSVSSGGFLEQVIANIKMPVYYCFMGVLMPLTVAACPYWRLLVLS